MNEDTYRLQEVQMIRSEINIHIQETYSLEVYALGAVGAIGAVIIGVNDKIPMGATVKLFLPLVPLAVVLLCWMRTRHVHNLITTMDAYLSLLESSLPKRLVSEPSRDHSFSKLNHQIDGTSFHGWVDFYYAQGSKYFKYETQVWILIVVSYVLFLAIYLRDVNVIGPLWQNGPG